MRFYRPLSKISALSFDLDDTLYNNKPIMLACEQQMIGFFAEQITKQFPYLSQTRYDYVFWQPFRQQVLITQPQLRHDVSALRLATYTQGLLFSGIEQAQAAKLAEQALAHFTFQRSNFTVPENIHQLLADLAQKYALIAITNGNVNTHSIGLSPYFQVTYQAGNGLLSKPDNDMFHRASEHLSLPCCEILHIGDCAKADIMGGLRAGMQTAWLTSSQSVGSLKVLPHVVINDILELRSL